MNTPKKISLTTDKTAQEEKWKKESLGELLDKAVAVLNPHMDEFGVTTPAWWISRMAIRAVCEEIIRSGCVPLPMEVAFVSRGGREEHRALDAFRHGLS